MKVEEANRMICEFNGREFVSMTPDRGYLCVMRNGEPNYETAYSASLDALVPVWEKLNVIVTHMEINYVEISSFKKHQHKAEVFIGTGKTIQEAACIATAKAIKDLTFKGEE